MASSNPPQQPFEAAARMHQLWLTFLQREPAKWTVGMAMRECGFSDEDSKNPTLQQRVRRLEKELSKCSTSSSTMANKSSASALSPPVLFVDAALQSPVSAVSESSLPSFMSALGSASNLSRPKDSFLGNCRRTSRQVLASRKANHKTKSTQEDLYKKCTAEVAKGKILESLRNDYGKKKATTVLRQEFAARVGVELSALPSVRTINQAIQEGRAGKTPPRRGPRGYMDEGDFRQLGEAVRALVAIAASNGDEKSYADLKKLINTVANSKLDSETPKRYDYTLIDRIFQKFGIDLDAAKLNPAEARRVLWTTKANLENMFDNWKDFLIEKEFAEAKTDENVDGAVELTLENIQAGHTQFSTGELIFTIANLRRILNVDETCLSLDGLNGNRGGRPSLSFFDPVLPRAGKAVSKCGVSSTLVIGGNAAGEATPPHFQFPSTAQEQNQQLRFSTIELSRDLLGQFGHDEPTRLSPTYGMNEKGGMDEAHFEKYITDLAAVLYPDAADVTGKRVVFKVDQGPGRSNILLLARLRARGIYLFPSVPNSSSVSQEMDQIFDLFKSLTRGNVDKLHSALMKVGESVSLGREDCCMIVFGGTHTLKDGSSVDLDEAFDRSFCKRRVLFAFDTVGAVPLTRKCLTNKKVRVELEADDSGIEEDETAQRIRELDQQLEACVAYLGLRGYTKAELLHVRAKRKQVQDQQVTLPHTRERQEAFLRAKTTGAKYKAMNGTHLTHEDMFIAEEMRKRTNDIKELENEKKNREAVADQQEEAFALIAKKEEAGYPLANINADKAKWTNPEIDVLLKWKLGKAPSASRKDEKLREWMRVREQALPAVLPWTADDEAKLVALKSDISIDDTELGKARRRLKQETNASIAIMSREELIALKTKTEAALAADGPDEFLIEDEDTGAEDLDEATNGSDANEGEESEGEELEAKESEEEEEEEEEESEEEESEEEESEAGKELPPPVVTRSGRARKPNLRYV